ncbi:MAG: hypothetical protein ACYTBJ_00670 [Planctomycetota bacterium]|jgi:hypothetical protein
MQSRQLVTDLLNEGEVERLGKQLTKAWMDGNMRMVRNTIDSLRKIVDGVEKIAMKDVWKSL